MEKTGQRENVAHADREWPPQRASCLGLGEKEIKNHPSLVINPPLFDQVGCLISKNGNHENRWRGRKSRRKLVLRGETKKGTDVPGGTESS